MASYVTALISSAFFVVALLASPANAQQLLKGEVRVTPMSSGGQTIGCSLEYTAVAVDRIHRPGRMIGVTGTYAWLAGKDRIGLAGMFKLGVAEFTEAMKPVPFRPASTTLKVGGRTQRAQWGMQCEDPNYLCAAYSTEGALSVFAGLQDDPIAVGFNRTEGGFDLMINLPFTFKEKVQLIDCMQDFMSSLVPSAEDRPLR